MSHSSLTVFGIIFDVIVSYYVCIHVVLLWHGEVSLVRLRAIWMTNHLLQCLNTAASVQRKLAMLHLLSSDMLAVLMQSDYLQCKEHSQLFHKCSSVTNCQRLYFSTDTMAL